MEPDNKMDEIKRNLILSDKMAGKYNINETPIMILPPKLVKKTTTKAIQTITPPPQEEINIQLPEPPKFDKNRK